MSSVWYIADDRDVESCRYRGVDFNGNPDDGTLWPDPPRPKPTAEQIAKRRHDRKLWDQFERDLAALVAARESA